MQLAEVGERDQVWAVRPLRWLAGFIASPLLGPGIYWAVAPYFFDVHGTDSPLAAIPFSYIAFLLVGLPSIALLAALRRLTAGNLIIAATLAGSVGAMALLRLDLRDLVPLLIWSGYGLLTGTAFAVTAGIPWRR